MHRRVPHRNRGGIVGPELILGRTKSQDWRVWTALVAVIALVGGGCAHSRDAQLRQRRVSNSSTDRSVSHSRDLLTAEEMRQHPTLHAATAYDAIRRLRPEYLATATIEAAGGSQASPTVFVDGIARGGADVLRTMQVALITEMRFVRPADAALRYGQDHRWGAILITTDR